MEILHVITRLVRGGASRHVLDVTRKLRDRGHEVSVAAGRDNTGRDSLWQEFQQAPVELVPLHSMTRPPGLHDISAVIELFRLIRKKQPDLLHVHTSKAGTLGTLAARLSGIPVIYSSHGHLFHRDAHIEAVRLTGLSRHFYFWLRRLTIGLTGTTLALSRQDLREQLQLGLAPESRYHIITNGLPNHWFEDTPDSTSDGFREAHGIPPDSFLVSNVGRLVREKGQEDLVRAWTKIAAMENIQLAIVGSGPRESFLRKLVTRLGLEGRIHITGPTDRVKQVLDDSDCFCFPSYYESQGIALMEAMARGLPCIATQTGGLAELLDDGTNGWAVPPGNPEAIAQTIQAVKHHPNEARRRGTHAREIIRDRYHLEHVIDRLETLYRRSVESPR